MSGFRVTIARGFDCFRGKQNAHFLKIADLYKQQNQYNGIKRCKRIPKKGNRLHSATDLQTKTEPSDNKEVRFFVIPFLAYSWRIFISLIHN